MPRPTIEGQKVRQIDLYCGTGTANKDYRITVTRLGNNDYSVYTEHGPSGRLNQGQCTGTGLSRSAAMRMADEASDAKQRGKSGSRYSVVSDRYFDDAPQIPPQAAPAPAPVRHGNKPSIKTLPASTRAKLRQFF